MSKRSIEDDMRRESERTSLWLAEHDNQKYSFAPIICSACGRDVLNYGYFGKVYLAELSEEKKPLCNRCAMELGIIDRIPPRNEITCSKCGVTYTGRSVTKYFLIYQFDTESWKHMGICKCCSSR